MKSVLPAALLGGMCLIFSIPSAFGQPASPAQSRASALPQVFMGGVPQGTANATPITLTIVDAINRGLEHNLGLLNASEGASRARGEKLRALADLLPNVSGKVAETRQVLNLEAFGFPLPAGFPSIVGPFNVFDARVFLSQSILDLKAINANKAEQHNVAAAEYSIKTARDIVVLVSANLYLEALAASARSESAQAQVRSAQAIFQQASDMKENGLVAGIEVLRAEVQLNSERTRATSAANDFEKAKLQLARTIGLPIGQAFTLVSELPNLPAPDITLEAALDQAYKARPDYQAALERVKAAEATLDSANGELLPSVHVNADYGALGLTPGESHGTYAVVGAVTVPIFNGGRSRGRIAEAESDLRQRRAETEDLKASIYYDVKSAFLDLQATKEQLDVATRARELAAQQLTQARDRFVAGVTTNVEVVQAQQAVAQSNEQYISAMYGYNVAKALLARGLGIAEQAARQYLGGIR